jgi:hypothetical protein
MRWSDQTKLLWMGVIWILLMVQNGGMFLERKLQNVKLLPMHSCTFSSFCQELN